MAQIDWIVLGLTISVVIGYGIWKTREKQDMHGYLLGDNAAKWWTVGLSVMATQASAVTFLSTPGQAYVDGMDFVQFYFALPIALIIICITFIPLYYKLKVYTAYEFLERRFDLKSRSLASFLFLIQRGLACGITIYAPAIILSTVLGWNLKFTAIFIGLIAVIYTVSGGTKAVHVTHRLQMTVIFAGLIIIFFLLLGYLPEEYSMSEMLAVAGANNKLEIMDTSFDLKERYNIWTAMIAAPFLFLSYFGTDQSQVQRYISGQSIRESRLGLLFNGLFKVPLQFFILFIGVLVFLFFQFNKAPIFFNQAGSEQVALSSYANEAQQLKDTYDLNFQQRKIKQSEYALAYRNDNQGDLDRLKSEITELSSQEKELRSSYKEIVKSVSPAIETNDKDYVFINFILNHIPNGLIGLLFAMIFFAAMSSTASELNALASTTTVDLYRRILKRDEDDEHYLRFTKLITAFWGVVAIAFASYCSLFENLIQFVNIIGSLFYGTILGIFLVAFYFKRIGGNAVFYAALITEVIVIAVYVIDINTEGGLIGYLWLNLIGALGVIIISHLLSIVFPKEPSAALN